MFLATCAVFLFDRTNVEMDKEETFQSIFCRGKKRLMVYLSRKGISLKRTFILLVWGITNISLEKKVMYLALLGKKAMTNLGSLLKSRDITLPTKVHLVKAMVFPVVMYTCRSWTIKKAEC